MGPRQTKHPQPLHDPQTLAWEVGIDKSWGGKKDLPELEKLDAFNSIGLSRQVMKSTRGGAVP